LWDSDTNKATQHATGTDWPTGEFNVISVRAFASSAKGNMVFALCELGGRTA